MNKSSNLTRTVMTRGMLINGSSGHESYSDDEKCRLPAANSIFDDENEEFIVAKRQQAIRTAFIRKSMINEKDVVRRTTQTSFDKPERRDSRTECRTKSSCQCSDYHNLPFQDNQDDYKNDCHLYVNIHNNSQLEKTGWLNTKHWLTIQWPGKVVLAPTQKWQRYWVQFKGSNLCLFMNNIDTTPQFILSTIDCLCYPSSEPKDCTFHFTIRTGDTYSFQTSTELDIARWMNCIYSHSLLTVDKKALKTDLEQLANEIVYENKMVQLAHLQYKLSRNEKTRSFILKQIALWKDNLEFFHMDSFRKRCQLSALTNSQPLPNTDQLFPQMSSKMKAVLDSSDAMTPCGLYACVIARQHLDSQRYELKQQLISSESRPTDQAIAMDVDYRKTFGSTVYRIILNDPYDLSGIEINRRSSQSVSISNVRKGSEGERLGLIKNDEIVMINDFIVQDLDPVRFHEYLNQVPVILTLRSSRFIRTPDASQSMNSRKITTPNKNTVSRQSDQLSPASIKPRGDINQFFHSKTGVFKSNNEQHLPAESISNTQQFQKLIQELVDTEKSYIQDIQYLLEHYIESFRKNPTVLSPDVIQSLYNCVKLIQQLQSTFLEHLQSALVANNILLSIARAFLVSSRDFKHYSTYCSLHLRLNRLLDLHQNNESLKGFLARCNPSRQHSSSFQSYLIKPVQRILKYPLFLQQMFTYCDQKENHQILAVERSKIKKAIKIMKKISRYINSMQELYEDFGQSFESLIERHHQTLEFNPPDLCVYGEVEWLNIDRFLSRRRYQCLKSFCFVFRNGCLVLVREQLHKKNQTSLLNYQANKSTADRFIRFLSIKELQVQFIEDDKKYPGCTWQLVQTNSRTQLKTYFRFANTDAQVFVKTVNDCISTNESEMLSLLKLTTNNEQLSSSQSCHDCLPTSALLNSQRTTSKSKNNRRSPSPVWKRRSTCSKKRPLSMINNKTSS